MDTGGLYHTANSTMGRWHTLGITGYNVAMLQRDRLAAELPILGLGEPFHFYPRIGSTNERAAELARAGSPHGTLVVTEEQTSGRGRSGKTWFTPNGTAIAMSLVVRPDSFRLHAICALSVLGALAVTESLERQGAEALIKWPNDVLLGPNKVAGVLVEADWEGNQLSHAILGIGVNVRPESVPDERFLDYPATSVDDVLGREVDRQRLLIDILEGVGQWLPRLGTWEVRLAWERRIAFLGCQVVVSNGGSAFRGVLKGLAQDGRLQLETEDGEVQDFAGSDLRLRPVDTPQDWTKLDQPSGLIDT